jgi:hypothetical protein
LGTSDASYHATRAMAFTSSCGRGAEKAMGKFMAHARGGAPGQQADAPRWEPSPEQVARMRATTGHFLAHLIRPTTCYRPGDAAGGPYTHRGRRRGRLERAARQPGSRGTRGPAQYADGRVPRRPRRIRGCPRAVRPRTGPDTHPNGLTRQINFTVRPMSPTVNRDVSKSRRYGRPAWI